MPPLHASECECFTTSCASTAFMLYLTQEVSLIEEYLEKTLWIANETKETYGDKKSVAKHNRYATRMRSIALQIHEKSPELKFEFSKLLTHDNDDVRIWVAHHILEVMQFEDDIRKEALNIIYKASKKNSVDGYGNKIWLENWLQEHPTDKKLL